MKGTGYKFLRFLHLSLAAVVAGGAAGSAILLLSGVHDRGLYLLHTWTVKYPFLVLIATSALLSTAGGWGFARRPWVLAKWIASFGILALFMAGGGAAIEGTVALADGLQEGTVLFGRLLLRARIFAVATAATVLGLFALSVFRPGKERKANPEADGAARGAAGARAKERKGSAAAKAVAATLAAAAPALLLLWGEIALIPIRSMPIERIDIAAMADGVYRGTYRAASSGYEVEAEIRDGSLVRAEYLNPRKSDYAVFAAGVLKKATQANVSDPDAVTGATTTSKALLKALEAALAKAPRKGPDSVTAPAIEN